MEEVVNMIPNREFKLNELSKVTSSASEIDTTIKKDSNLYLSDLYTKFLKADKICILGDSITYGAAVLDKNNVWSYNLKEYFIQAKKINDLGYCSALNIHNFYHNITLDTVSNWVANYTNHKSIQGFSYDSSVINANLIIDIPNLSQTKCKLYFTKNDIDSVIEIYLNGVLNQTLNILANGNDFITSDEISFTATTNSIKVLLKSGKVSITGAYYYNTSLSNTVDVYCSGGRRISYITQTILDEYLKYDLMLFALSYNDVGNLSDDAQKTKINNTIDAIATNFISNNKTFIYLNFVWSLSDEENFVLQKIKSAFGNYNKCYILDYKSTIIDDTGSLANESFRTNVLKEWDGTAHPNDIGHKRIFKYLTKTIFNRENDFDTKYDLVTQSYSTYSKNNTVPISSYNVTCFGLNNKSLNKGQHIVLLGMTNETRANNTVAIGENNLAKDMVTYIVGKNNSSERKFTTIFGTYAKALNSGLYFGFSDSTIGTKQLSKSIFTATTTNATETYLRNAEGSASLTTITNTNTIIKGSIYCFDETNNMYSEFKVDCYIKNRGNINTLVNTNGTTNGVLAISNPNNVSCSIVAGVSNFTIRATGNTNSLKWTASLEFIEIDK